MYKPMIEAGGFVHLKTDNTGLFDYTLMLLENRWDVKNLEFTYDFYSSIFREDHFGIQTRYEKMFSDQGENIKYLKFQFVH